MSPFPRLLRLPTIPTPLHYVVQTAKFLAAGHLLFEYGFSLSPAAGPSMLPTFEVSDELLLISKLNREGRGVRVGDLVVYKIPIFATANGIKRVIGMPGDYVVLNSPGSGSDAMIQVPQGHCWIIGDNLPASRDSREFGPVPLALIDGKVIARMWPLWKFQWMRNPLQKPREPPES